MPSALLCPFLSSTLLVPGPLVVFSTLPCPCPAHPLSRVMSSTLCCCSSHCTNRFAFTDPLSPARPALRSTLPLLCIHLDFYLPFVSACTQLYPCAVLILTPDLYPAPICAILPPNISLLGHLHPILLSSPFRYPSRPALPSTMACLVLPSPCSSYPLTCPIHCSICALPVAMF